MATDEQREYRERLSASLQHYYCEQLGLADVEMRVDRRLRRELGKNVVRRIQRRGVALRDRRVLEVGAGWGELTYEVAALAAEAVGIEPDVERVAIARLLAHDASGPLRFVEGVGEDLPFEDDSFDVIFSFQVLEHVQDYRRCLLEMSRVVRPDGVVYGCAPNYFWPIEGHYRVLYPPLLPKPLAHAYLRARGRNSDFIEHINYLTPWGVRSALRQAGLEFEEFGFDQARASGWSGWRGVVARTLYRLGLYPAIEFVARPRR